ncbi:hypothetical protein NET02_09745 [Thermomicrobiaceae bacterium CFH 74404]|uniref:DUF4367 domain-containing protein n=1 Tax=Thermalbibacter longus TaxID=2951981 RepID=A0AA42BB47_9BACT|nr:hypothetical protein [Thermalbibacter longus]MCM8749429.1 hypothetical protein [Thermalbibacter longus]
MLRRRSCPGAGELRILLDRGDGALPPAQREHVRHCPACQRLVRELSESAEIARRVVDAATPGTLPDPALAYRRWQQHARGRRARSDARREGGIPMGYRRSAPVRFAAAGIAAVAVLALVVTLTPFGALADEFVNRFRVQQFAAITVPMEAVAAMTAQTEMLPPEQREAMHQELEQIAQFTTTFEEESMREVGSLDEAATLLGREPAAPGELPAAVSGASPRYFVGEAGTASVTIDVARAREMLARLGVQFASLPDPAVAPTVTVTLNVPASAAQVYESGDQMLVVAEMGSPELILPETIDPELLREDLLSLPGLPPELVAQIRAVRDWRETLIIPVPADASTRQVTLHGASGLLIEAPEGSAVLWQKDGVLHAVGGTMDGETVLSVAESVR